MVVLRPAPFPQGGCTAGVPFRRRAPAERQVTAGLRQLTTYVFVDQERTALEIPALLLARHSWTDTCLPPDADPLPIVSSPPGKPASCLGYHLRMSIQPKHGVRYHASAYQPCCVLAAVLLLRARRDSCPRGFLHCRILLLARPLGGAVVSLRVICMSSRS